MNLPELKSSLAEKKISPLYIFTGPEIAVMDIYIKKVASLFSNVIYAESLSSIVPQLKSNSLIRKDSTLYIIRNDTSVTSAEKIWSSLISGTLQKSHTLLFTFNNIDKRGKFYKTMQNVITYFDLLSSNVLLKYVDKELHLNKDNAEYLIEITGYNYSKLLLEMDKVKNLAKHLNIDNDKAFDMCVEHNAFYIPPDGDVFGLLNAILSRNIKATYVQLNKFKLRGENPLGILSLLHTNIKGLLQLQCAEGLKDISKVTGLNGFQINNLSKFKGMYSTLELIRILKILNYLDKAAKQTGAISVDILLDFLLVKIF